MMTASAPGSMMLMGEHAVVRGGLGIAASLSGRVFVMLKSRNDFRLEIKSDRFDAFSCQIADLSTIENHREHAYSIEVLRYFQRELTHGVDIHIKSDLSPTHGFGSSAALVVALVAALQGYTKVNTSNSMNQSYGPMASLNPLDIAAIARDIIINVQGQASGCDAYTSALGGIVAISSTPGDLFAGSIVPIEKRQVFAKRFEVSPPLTAIYTGYKTKTPIVLEQVAKAEAKQPDHFADLFKEIDAISKKALPCLETQNWPALGKLMRQQFDLQQQLGVVDETSAAIIEMIDHDIKETVQPFGAKISGSGLGDCLIALGDLPANLFPNAKLPNTEQFKVMLDGEGVKVSECTS